MFQDNHVHLLFCYHVFYEDFGHFHLHKLRYIDIYGRYCKGLKLLKMNVIYHGQITITLNYKGHILCKYKEWITRNKIETSAEAKTD